MRTIRNLKVNVGANTLVLPANVSRVAVIFSSPTTTDVFISFGDSAAASQGISLRSLPGGGITPFVVTRDMIGDMIGTQINGLANGGATDMAVLEVIDGDG